MPQGWEHAVVDLMAYGRPHFDMHREKDAPAQWLGPGHRKERHEWYNAFGDAWTMEEPFPQEFERVIDSIVKHDGAGAAEVEQARCTHDYLDKSSDLTHLEQRAHRRGFLAWLVLQPDLLESRFGVDVDRGRILRDGEGEQIWESCPELPHEYDRLRKYVEAVLRNDDRLRAMVDRYS